MDTKTLVLTIFVDIILILVGFIIGFLFRR